MKVHSYTICLYGADYLGYALKSIIDSVELAHVIYTPHPSHGHSTTQPCPETKEDIWAASDIGSNKIRRYELRNIFNEGPQRDRAVSICKNAGADMVLVVDCDEVWDHAVLQAALSYAWFENKARNWLINFSHLWRGFDYVCRDQAWPVRIIDLRHENGTGYIPKEFGEIWHFGYCIRDEILKYKIRIHGHKNEFRPEWYKEKWSAWPPVPDCHPTNERGFWNPVPFEKEKLPRIMREHPFYHLEKVE